MYRHTNIHIQIYTDIQIYTYANRDIYSKYTDKGTQTYTYKDKKYRNSNTNTGILIHRHANIQTYKNECI